MQITHDAESFAASADTIVRQVDDIKRALPSAKSLVAFVVRTNPDSIRSPARSVANLEFHHTGGATRGMEVEWRFEPVEDGSWEVSIHHALALRWPLVGELVARHVIGPHFIDAIAGRTLRRVKALAERAEAGA